MLCAVPLFAQPLQFGAETPVSRPEYGEVAGGSDPRVATNGSEFLAIWSDPRERRGAESIVYAARFAADGTLLDPLNIRLGSGLAGDVLWTGRVYLAVVVATHRATAEVIAIGADGVIRSRETLTGFVQPYANVSLATNGANVLLAAAHGTAVRLDLDGRVLGSITISEGRHVSVASNGTDYLVAIANPTGGVTTQLVMSSGSVSEPQLLFSGEKFVSHVAAGSNGDSFLVVWTVGSVFAQEVSRSHAALSPRQTLIDVIPSASLPRIAWRGGEYLITWWRGAGDLVTMRASARGESLSTARVFAQSTGDADVVTDASGRGAFVWIERTAGPRAALFVVPDAFYAVTPLARAAHAQLFPKLVRAGRRIVAGWAEIIGGAWQLRIGVPGGEPVIVANVDSARFDLVSHGDLLWVVWEQGGSLRVRRYTTALAPIDAEAHAFRAPAALVRSVAAGEGSLLVAWRTLDNTREIVASVIRVEGATLVANELQPLSNDTVVNLAEKEPTVAWNGSEFVVAWVHQLATPFWQFPEPVPEEIHVVRVRPDGRRFDVVPLVVERREPTFLADLRAGPANGGGVLLTWRDSRHWYGTLFRGSELPPVRTLRDTTESIVDVAPLPRGYLLFSPTHVHRFSDDLVAEGEPGALPSAFADAAALGEATFLIYTRPTTEPEYGGTPRAFVRSNLDPRRRRSVR